MRSAHAGVGAGGAADDAHEMPMHLFGYAAPKTAANAFTVRLANELRSKNVK